MLDYLRERGEIQYSKVGARVLFAVVDLEAFIKARRVDVTALTPKGL